MIKIFAGIATAILMISSTFAADSFPVKAPPLTAYSYNWTGIYAGLHAGYGWGSTQDISNAAASKQEIRGALGGFQIGYNHQIANIVLGLETDVSIADIRKDWGGANQFDPYYGSDKLTTTGSVRGRLGYAFDRFLPYVTGGFAWGIGDHGFGCDAARVTATNGCQNKRGGKAFYVNDDHTVTGYTVGAGFEYALASNVSVKSEYLYTDYGSANMSLVDPNYPAKSIRDFETKYHAIKFGVNYRFN